MFMYIYLHECLISMVNVGKAGVCWTQTAEQTPLKPKSWTTPISRRSFSPIFQGTFVFLWRRKVTFSWRLGPFFHWTERRFKGYLVHKPSNIGSSEDTATGLFLGLKKMQKSQMNILHLQVDPYLVIKGVEIISISRVKQPQGNPFLRPFIGWGL